jgi:hypothetical protein
MVRENSQNAEWRCDQKKRVTRIKKRSMKWKWIVPIPLEKKLVKN